MEGFAIFLMLNICSRNSYYPHSVSKKCFWEGKWDFVHSAKYHHWVYLITFNCITRLWLTKQHFKNQKYIYSRRIHPIFQKNKKYLRNYWKMQFVMGKVKIVPDFYGNGNTYLRVSLLQVTLSHTMHSCYSFSQVD